MKTSFGLIMTSRRIFCNVRTYRSQYTTASEYSKSFVPVVYMFVRLEHEFAYTQLFTTVVNYAQLFFAVDLDVAYGSLDHADYIANAYETVWPEIMSLDCYPRLNRKCREKIRLFVLTPTQSAEEYYHGNIEMNIRQIYLTRSPDEFAVISKKCLIHWRKEGQTTYAAGLRRSISQTAGLGGTQRPEHQV
ncbi:hypothetical protein PHMEG_00023955 [Phytophthora megakarya]|uniref:Uncharacterized protein n=1 Tax=Phytophthora megakarya TaxID=4795 RepID=A0A225VFP5_9STRA|nr:hypothetical protein PHMEG_00023955 [Phytophthora megakarya]